MTVDLFRLDVPRAVVEAATLRRLADLMDEDDARTGNVGIPVSYGHYLASVAVSGTAEEWNAEWLRLLRAQGMQAANAWADEQEQRTKALIQLVYPGGATAHAKTAAEVRALADAMARAGER
ncbi:hypothetical protein [Streptomyces sp. NPDC001492]